jgi:hypothetical protein
MRINKFLKAVCSGGWLFVLNTKSKLRAALDDGKEAF